MKPSKHQLRPLSTNRTVLMKTRKRLRDRAHSAAPTTRSTLRTSGKTTQGKHKSAEVANGAVEPELTVTKQNNGKAKAATNQAANGSKVDSPQVANRAVETELAPAKPKGRAKATTNPVGASRPIQQQLRRVGTRRRRPLARLIDQLWPDMRQHPGRLKENRSSGEPSTSAGLGSWRKGQRQKIETLRLGIAASRSDGKATTTAQKCMAKKSAWKEGDPEAEGKQRLTFKKRLQRLSDSSGDSSATVDEAEDSKRRAKWDGLGKPASKVLDLAVSYDLNEDADTTPEGEIPLPAYGPATSERIAKRNEGKKQGSKYASGYAGLNVAEIMRRIPPGRVYGSDGRVEMSPVDRQDIDPEPAKTAEEVNHDDSGLLVFLNTEQLEGSKAMPEENSINEAEPKEAPAAAHDNSADGEEEIPEHDEQSPGSSIDDAPNETDPFASHVSADSEERDVKMGDLSNKRLPGGFSQDSVAIDHESEAETPEEMDDPIESQPNRDDAGLEPMNPEMNPAPDAGLDMEEEESDPLWNHVFDMDPQDGPEAEMDEEDELGNDPDGNPIVLALDEPGTGHFLARIYMMNWLNV